MFATLGVSLLVFISTGVVGQKAITASGTNFTLKGDNVVYQFHVDPANGELISDHFGGPIDDFIPAAQIDQSGWHANLATKRREFPDIGRSDFRLPAIHIEHADGDTVSEFAYQSHEIVQGKPSLSGLPATYGNADDVTTLVIRMYDNYSDVSAMLSYSLFPKHDAIARSFQIANNGSDDIIIQRAASFSTDFPNLDLDMIEVHGDWSHEFNRIKRRVDYGETSFRSSEGYASHLHNPFFALTSPSTTESAGEVWGFNLVYSGSFAATAERFSTGHVRVLLGLNPLHTSLKVRPGETFTSPEAVAVYSSNGVGGMSRAFHSLYRTQLSRSNYTDKTRPILVNSWEGNTFKINDTAIVNLAGEAQELGIELLVMDDGWFGIEYPRNNDTLGLGDFTPNPAKFPDGLGPMVDQVNSLTVKDSSDRMRFGIWLEPEMVNPNSTLYKEHPDWALHSGRHPRTSTRNQLVLNLALPEVQEHVIQTVSRIIDSANIEYIKWDNNRGIHEQPRPSNDHAYILGLYRVVDNLTTTYPHVLWEGCASGGGRFDAGLLHYWPQHWTSDNTDASDRLTIQMGTSLVYPPSSMGCHVSAIPNGNTKRNITVEYRAHVAMMCGSFGFELNPSELSQDERVSVSSIMAEARAINPIVISGDFYRLALSDESNWPAVQFVSKNGTQAVLFAFQQKAVIKPAPPPLRLQGLDRKARYSNTYDNATYSGASYMNGGLNIKFPKGDYRSKLIWLNKE